jgi:PAS domain S-box-containing protein
VLIDPTGRQLLNLLRPLGTPLPSMANVEVFQRTVATRQPAVSDLFMSPTAHSWLVAVNVPVLRDGTLRYVLSAGMNPAGLAALLAPAQLHADAIGMIVDRQGIVVAHSQDQERRVGKPAALGEAEGTRRKEEAVVLVRTGEGGDVYAAVSRAPRSHFAVGLTVPAERLDGPLRRSLTRLSGAAVAVFAVSLGLAFLAGCRLRQRTAGLARALSALGRGETVAQLPTFRVTEFKGVTQALHDAMALLQARSEALQQSEGRYRRLTEESAEGIIIHQAGVIQFINISAARTLGYGQPAEAVGQPVAAHIAPEYRDAVLARIEARLRGDAVPATTEMEVLRRDGSRLWLEATAATVTWDGAPATRVSGIDITDRRRREAAEREAENLRAVASLANATAHEINNPLTVIIGNLQLLREALSDRAAAEVYADRVQHGVQRIREMVEHMRQITRLEPLKELDTGGLPTLDLRRSSGPVPGGGPPGTEEGTGPPRNG